MNTQMLQQVTEAVGEGRPFVLVTLVETIGSAPRPVGSRMLVFANGRIRGTVGGGTLEHRLIEEALLVLGSGKPGLIRLDLMADLQMTCGGRVAAFLEPIELPVPVVIFGAGHVARALAPLLVQLEFDVVTVDDRADWADPSAFPHEVRVRCQEFPLAARELVDPQQTLVVIMTRDHENDVPILREILPRNPVYVGILASKSTRNHVEEQLFREGISLDQPAVHVPIGVPIGSKSPTEIAVSIAAELVSVRNRARKTGRLPEEP